MKGKLAIFTQLVNSDAARFLISILESSSFDVSTTISYIFTPQNYCKSKTKSSL